MKAIARRKWKQRSNANDNKGVKINDYKWDNENDNKGGK